MWAKQNCLKTGDCLRPARIISSEKQWRGSISSSPETLPLGSYCSARNAGTCLLPSPGPAQPGLPTHALSAAIHTTFHLSENLSLEVVGKGFSVGASAGNAWAVPV